MIKEGKDNRYCFNINSCSDSNKSQNEKSTRKSIIKQEKWWKNLLLSHTQTISKCRNLSSIFEFFSLFIHHYFVILSPVICSINGSWKFRNNFFSSCDHWQDPLKWLCAEMSYAEIFTESIYWHPRRIRNRFCSCSSIQDPN
jgi:hypothetical protein